MINKIRDFFDQRAAGWDAMFEPALFQRASEIVAGLKIAPRSKVLDVGCGTGALIPILCEQMQRRGFVAATDLSANMLREAEKKYGGGFAAFFQSDAAHLPVKNGVFDWILCYSVFPHFLDQAQTVAQLAAALKPGGRLAVFHSKSRHDINAFHRTVGGEVGGHELPAEPAMRAILASAGLEVESLQNSNDRYLALARRPL